MRVVHVLSILIIASLTVSADRDDDDDRRGRRRPAKPPVTIDIAFSGGYGYTTTNDMGTFYTRVYGEYEFTTWEDKVYIPEYWGVYPLYYFGTEVGASVIITNNRYGKARFRVTREAFVLHADGSNGVALTDPESWEIELRRGRTAVIDASFVGEFREGAESGLDRFWITVDRILPGDDDDDEDEDDDRRTGDDDDEDDDDDDRRGPRYQRVATAEGIFCPPSIELEGILELMY